MSVMIVAIGVIYKPSPGRTYAIHCGALVNAKKTVDPVFGFDAVTECPGVPNEIPLPRETWTNKNAFDEVARKLAALFKENFKAYEAGASAEINKVGPI